MAAEESEAGTELAGLLGARILDVVNDVLGERGGGFCEAFVGGVQYVDADGESLFLLTAAPGQREIITGGLVLALDERAREAFRDRG